MRRPNWILLLLAAFCCVQQLALAQQPEADKPEPEAVTPVPAEDTPVGDTDTEETMEEPMEEEESFTRARVHHEGLVKMGSDAVLKADESADAVVVIGGNAKVEGRVKDAIVVIGGNLDLSGEVHREVVVVLGNVNAR